MNWVNKINKIKKSCMYKKMNWVNKINKKIGQILEYLALLKFYMLSLTRGFWSKLISDELFINYSIVMPRFHQICFDPFQNSNLQLWNWHNTHHLHDKR